MFLSDYYKGRKVFITGHTGFKGAWLTKWLIELGAIVSGVSLPNHNEDSMFHLLKLDRIVNHHEFDIRDQTKLMRILNEERPEFIFHLAAQPLVIESFKDPYYTHSVNYLGTLNLLEAIRNSSFCKKIIIITSDKVYKPNSSLYPLDEKSPLGGSDPYSASKSSVEILVSSYRESYFNQMGIHCITARAGNVIGYGDWAKNRLFPDVFRAIINKSSIELRNPNSIRPWQDVNDISYGYLLMCMRSESLIKDEIFSLNFGPNKTTLQVIEMIDICRRYYPKLKVRNVESKLKETNLLILNTSLVETKLKWSVRYSVSDSINMMFEQITCHLNKDYVSLEKLIDESINGYLFLINKDY